MPAYPLTVRLQPCKGLLASVLLAHVAAALALFYARSELWLMLSGGAAILVSALMAVVAEQRKRNLEMLLYADGSAGLRRGQGQLTVVRVCPGVVALGSALWFELKPVTVTRRPRRVRLMLVEGSVADGRWRSLKIWLRHRALSPAAASS